MMNCRPSYVLLSKYAANGEELWKRRYNSGAGVNDEVRGVAMDAAGNVFLTGTSKTVKIGWRGDFLWAVPYAGRAVVANADYVCVTGFSEVDWATAQLYNFNGGDAWVRTYNGAANRVDLSQTIAFTPQGDIVVAGAETLQPPPGGWACQTLIKYAQDGAERWRAQAPRHYGHYSNVEVRTLLRST